MLFQKKPLSIFSSGQKPSVEKLNLKFDVTRLKDHLEQVVFPLAPAKYSRSYYGWSVQSSTGSYQDGWHSGASAYCKEGKDNSFQIKVAEEINMKAPDQYRKPTEICTNYLEEVMKTLIEMGFYPCRARIICLEAKGATDWHRDHRDGFYWPRLHIPIITNPKSRFITSHDITHMSADGSAYLVNTAQMHMAVNEGEEHRYHFIAQVWDTQCHSKFFSHPKQEIRFM